MATDKEQFAELLENLDFEMITSFKQTYIDEAVLFYRRYARGGTKLCRK